MSELEAMGDLENFLNGLDLEAGDLGQPMYLDADVLELKKNINLIEQRQPALKEIANIVDEHTKEVLQKLNSGAKSIQKEADDVWTVFDDFVQNGPVEIKYTSTTNKTGGIRNIRDSDAEIKEKFLEKQADYAQTIITLTKQSILFSTIEHQFESAKNTLELQTRLAGQDDLFSSDRKPYSIQGMLKQAKKLTKEIKSLREKIDQTVSLIREFGNYDTKAGDTLYFKILVAYLDYIDAVYKLEYRAREIEATIVQMNAPSVNKVLGESSIERARKIVGEKAKSFGKEAVKIGQKYGPMLLNEFQRGPMEPVERILEKYRKDMVATDKKIFKSYQKIDSQATSASGAYQPIKELNQVTLSTNKGLLQSTNRALRSALQDAF
jgi:hypothetical protein|tara:strand:- start:910 stop:2049 length:1140 start_codon:yes stop_codon:yes gene_type:complete